MSLPFKLLLFVLVDGWGLIINALVTSYHTSCADSPFALRWTRMTDTAIIAPRPAGHD